MTIISKSAAQTKKIAARLARKILKASAKGGSASGGKNYKALPAGRQVKARIIALTGDLGSGKTTFVQGFAKALGIKHQIVSPTFLIFRNYELRIMNYEFFYHVDLYRIHNIKELDILNFKSILHSPFNIVLIEWAEKIFAKGESASGGKNILPKDTIWVHFNHGRKENERIIAY